MLAPVSAPYALQPALDALLAQHPRLKRLLPAHSALLAALATGSLSQEATAEALHRLRTGDAPAQVATAAGIAPWLDLLPIEALTTDLLGQPMSPGFATFMRRSVDLPITIMSMQKLLTATRVAHQFGGEIAARWMAPYSALQRYNLTLTEIALMSAYLQVRAEPDFPANRLAPELRGPSSRGLSDLEELARNTFGWLSLSCLETLFGPVGVTDPWRPDGTSNGHDIRCLRSAGHLMTAASIRPELIFYAPHLLLDQVRLYEVSLEGRFVCMAEVGHNGRHNRTQQFQRVDRSPNAAGCYGMDGRDDHEFGLEARLALFGHFAMRPPSDSPGEARPGGHVFPPAEVLTAQWQSLMRPYLTHRVSSLFPPTMTRDALIALLHRIFELVPRAHLGHLLWHVGMVLQERHPR